MDWNDAFDYLLAPVLQAAFRDQHWREQRPLYIPGARDKFAALFSRERFLHAIRNVPPNRSIHLKAVYTDAAEISSDHGCLGADEALQHFARGATLCATAIEVADPALAAFRDALRRQWPSPDPLLFNCYYSPDGQGFGTHFDSQSVWVLQIEGAKRWRFSRQPAVAFPAGGENAAASRMAVPELDSVDLQPGDVLYLPPGTWHRGEALGPSLALSLTRPHDGMLNLAARALRARLLKGNTWRRHFPAAHEGAEAVAAALSECLDDLKSTVARLSLDELRDLWYAETFASSPAKAPQSSVRELEDDELLQLAAAPLLLFPRENDAVVYHAGQKYTLPPECRTLLDALASREPITAGGAVSMLGRELLMDLVQIGIVTSSPGEVRA